MPVAKTLVLDLLTEISPVYPHDKTEDLALIGSSQVAISNDDGFGDSTTDKTALRPKPGRHWQSRRQPHLLSYRSKPR
ncbi:MAG: hypothetical protein ACRYFR_15090 [Janthinobacterium lividum]